MNIQNHIELVKSSTEKNPIDYAIVTLIAEITLDEYPNYLFSITNHGCYTNTNIFPEANCKVYPTSEIKKIDVEALNYSDNDIDDMNEMMELDKWTDFEINISSIMDSHLYTCDAIVIIKNKKYEGKLFYFERNPKIYDPFEFAELTRSKDTEQYMGFIKLYNCINPFLND